MSDKTAEHLKKILAVNRKINSTLKLDELLGVIMQVAAEVMRTEASSLMLIDEKTDQLVFRVALGEKGRDLVEKFRLRIGEGIAGSVAGSGVSVIVNDPASDSRFARRVDNATGFSTKAIVCVPVRIRGRIAGVLQAINPLDRKNFDAEDLELFEIFSEQAAIALDNARVHAELVEQEKLKQALKIAHEIQMNFLPDLTAKPFPVDLAAESVPALDIGGDFYDVLQLGPSRTGIVIGDVSGKGVPAALYMVRVISEYRFWAPRCEGPAELLSTLNRSLAERSQRGMFVTLLYAEIDTDQKVMRWGLAGHSPMLRRAALGDTAFLEGEGGLPLGLDADAVYKQTVSPVSSGDQFLLFTDGLTEARDKQGREFGIENLKSVFAGKTAAESVSRLMKAWREFAKDTAQHDDTTALAVRIY